MEPREDKTARRAEALRANLHRRKAQARGSAPSPPEDAPPGPDDNGEHGDDARDRAPPV